MSGLAGSGRLARRAAAAAFYYGGAFDLYTRHALKDRAIILMYHRVLAEPPADGKVEPGMFVTRRTFDRQLGMLKESHTLVTMDQLGEWRAGAATFAKPPCAITFDDGWADNYVEAFPLLQKHGATATVFLITGAIGDSHMLTWPQVHEMERYGIAFGSHTVTHAQLGLCAPAQIRTELAQSRATLEERLAKPSRWFCFPKGSHSNTACELVEEYYAGAVTTLKGWVSRNDDPCRLRRIGVHDDVGRTPALFAWRLALLR